MNVPTLANPRHFQSVYNVFCRQEFGVDEAVDAQLLEKLLVLRLHVFGVVNLSHGLFCAKIVRHGAGCYVDGLFEVYRNKEVGMLYTCFLQHFYACRLPLQCKKVVVLTNLVQVLFLLVNKYNVVLVARKKLCQISSNGVCSCYNYLHTSVLRVLLTIFFLFPALCSPCLFHTIGGVAALFPAQ